MRKNLQTAFSARQYMLSKDFEIYYYNDLNLSGVASHSHDYYEFYFFLEGNVAIEIEDARYPLRCGDMVLIPPGVPHHAVILNGDLPYRRFVFWISAEYCNQLLQLSQAYGYLAQHVRIARNYIFRNDPISFNLIQTKLVSLLEEIHSERFGKEAKVQLSVSDLLLHLNRLVYDRNHPKSAGSGQDLYAALLDYIDEHVEEDLSLDALSAQFFVSKYHIAHLFKDHLGIPVHQYIIKKRLTLCREALLGDTGIAESCRFFGFGDYSSFYRAFKKEYGVSPKDFRAAQLKKNLPYIP